MPLRRVTGTEYSLIRILMIINIWWVGTRRYRNPIKSLRAVSSLVRNFEKLRGGKKLIRAFKINGKYAWDIFSPAWPSRAFNSFFINQLHEIQSISEEHTSLRRLLVAITKKCPLQCEHCSEADTLYRDDVLSVEEFKSKIGDFVDQGVGQLVYSGGEPLSRFDDLTRLIRHFRASCDQWIYTSGFGLTLNKAQALKDAGLNGVAVSLDHHLEHQHNHFRGTTSPTFG